MLKRLIGGLLALMTVTLLVTLPAAPAAAQFSDGYNFLKAVRDRDVLKAKGLMDKPGSTVVNARDIENGETALGISVRRRDAPWMVFLLQNGADPNVRDRDGNTPLIASAGSSFEEGVRVMLAGKAQVDIANSRGETALIRAVQAKAVASAQHLLAAGADPDRPDNLTGMSARDYAARDVRTGPLAKLLADAPKKAPKARFGPSL